MSRTIPLSALVATSLLLSSSLLLTGCNTAKPAPQFTSRMSVVVSASPGAALSALRQEAVNEGGVVTAENATSFTADYGVQVRRIPVPTEYGLWGTRVSYRETEVHTSVTYAARAGDGGTVVSLLQNPIYWHPDYKVWLPGPHDTVPGLSALRELSAGAN